MPAKVRLRKDVLKVGRWLTGYTPDGKPTFWTVTRETLDRLARNFASQLAAGYRHPLQWGHCANVPFGDAATAGITDIKRIWREEDALFAEFEVSPEVARTLTAMNRQVSVSVVPRWQTQAGKSWDESLTHIAIVDHGAVPGQAPFVQLSAMKNQTRSTIVSNQRSFQQLSAKVPTLNIDTLAREFNRLLDHVSPGTQVEVEPGDTLESYAIRLALKVNSILPPDTGESRQLSASLRNRGGRQLSPSERANQLLGLSASPAVTRQLAAPAAPQRAAIKSADQRARELLGLD